MNTINIAHLGVTYLNDLSSNVTLVGGTGITVTPSGQTNVSSNRQDSTLLVYDSSLYMAHGVVQIWHSLNLQKEF